MDIQTDATRKQLREAARLSRTGLYWLPFLAKSWHSTLILVVVCIATVDSTIYNTDPHWKQLSLITLLAMFWTAYKWIRWSASFRKAGVVGGKQPLMLSLKSDGIRRSESNGASSFLQWSGYSYFSEASNMFVLRGPNITTIIPVDEFNRESVRSILERKVCYDGGPT